MARTVTIAMPDGSEKVVKNIPDSVTDEELKAKIKNSSKIAPVKEGGVEKFTIGMGAGFTRAGQGIKQLGLKLGEKAGVVSEQDVEDYTNDVKKEREFFAQTPVGQTKTAKAGQVVGEALPFVAIPGGAAGGTLARTATGATAGGVSAATEFTEDSNLFSGERFRNIAGGLLFGGAFPLVTSAVSGGSRILKNTINELTEAGGGRQIKNMVSKADLDTPVQKVAEDLGTWLTPSEASGRLDLKAMESGLKIRGGTESSKLLANRLKNRTVKISDSIESVLESVSQKNPSAAAFIKKGYKNLADTRVSPEYYNKKIFSNPVIRREWKKFSNSPDWKAQLQDVPKTSAKRLDEFKRYLLERESSLFKNEKKQAAKNLSEFRKSMVNDLDAMVPEYGVARGMSQLNIIYDKLAKAASKSTQKTRDVDGVWTTDAIDLFKRTFKSDEQYNDLMRGLNKLPDAQKKLTDLRNILLAIEDSPVNKSFSSSLEKGIEPAGTGGLGFAGAVAQGVGKTAKSRNLESMLLFITDPRFKSSLLDDLDPTMFQKSSPAALESFNKLSSRMSALTATPEPEENEPIQIEIRK